MFNPKNKNKRAFTLIETLVALSIFSVSILSVLVITSTGISNTGHVEKKIVASYLAQEGIEYIRNMRDTYMLYSDTAEEGWELFKAKFPAACTGGNWCYFNDSAVNYSNDNSLPITDLSFSTCGTPNSTSICPLAPLFYHANSGKYDYIATGGTTSNFARRINLTQITAGEWKLSSTVSWTQGSKLYSVNFVEYLYNWIEQ